ncbi:DNA binding protein motif protein [Ranid herpesvirus 3]|uniref:DNA binding protein motif protein n=1 Tax=Ranid herpesvirus 3 TaxID=1987509 RepID=A0A1X9T562_9VIRU|nr:DNA binding protein motif protein [Ranid herpesvirus 3]ARR28841.1 DNA binding protein motif protein [Ranid herpesvirus 3]
MRTCVISLTVISLSVGLEWIMCAMRSRVFRPCVGLIARTRANDCASFSKRASSVFFHLIALLIMPRLTPLLRALTASTCSGVIVEIRRFNSISAALFLSRCSCLCCIHIFTDSEHAKTLCAAPRAIIELVKGSWGNFRRLDLTNEATHCKRAVALISISRKTNCKFSDLKRDLQFFSKSATAALTSSTLIFEKRRLCFVTDPV